jgi:dihydrofolate reductase
MNRLIVAMDRKRGMAKGGILPWYIPEDEQYYDKSTRSYGGNVLMGSTTFKTIGAQPMPGRQNYVLTRDKTPMDGVEAVNDLDRFLKDFQDKDLWIIGGANIFSQVIQAGEADELYITHIEAFFNCNQFFPEYEQNFRLVEKSDLHEQNGFIFTYAKYVKNS